MPFSSQDIHQAVFNQKPPSVSVEDMDNGIRNYLKQKHARFQSQGKTAIHRLVPSTKN